MGIIRCAAVLLLGLSAYRETIKENRANLFYFKLNLLGLALYTCVSFLPLVSRFGYYLITAHVLLVPGILMGMPDEAPEPGGAPEKRRWKEEKSDVPPDSGFLPAVFCLFPPYSPSGGSARAALSQLDFYGEGMVEWLIYFLVLWSCR